jgi:hypothetical protein
VKRLARHCNGGWPGCGEKILRDFGSAQNGLGERGSSRLRQEAGSPARWIAAEFAAHNSRVRLVVPGSTDTWRDRPEWHRRQLQSVAGMPLGHRDDDITELLFHLADAKLWLDKVSDEDSRLDSDAAEAIMGMDDDYDAETRERLRSAVPPHEWSKYALYNFALDWVIDQALMRMKLECKWPFQENDGFVKA